MAVEVVQKPNENVIPAYSDIVFTTKDTGTGTLAAMLEARYKFVCDVYINNTKVSRLKVSPNNNKIGVFNVSKIVQDYVQETRQAGAVSKFEQVVQTHVIHNTDRFSRNDSTIVHLEVRFGQEYLLLGETLTQFNGYNSAGDPAVSVQNVNVQFNASARYYYKVFNGCLQHEDGFEAFDVTPYLGSTNSDKLLTKFPSYSDSGLTQKVRRTDYHTIAMFDSDTTLYPFETVGGVSESTNATHIQIVQYDSAGSTLSTNIFSQSANGAAQIEGEFATVGLTPRNYIFCGVGGKNISNSILSLNSSCAYYEVFRVNSGSTLYSQKYRFEIQDDDCKGYETVRLAFLNSFGAWDYYNFTKKSTKSTAIKRNQFRQGNGNWQDVSETTNWTYNTFEGGKGSYSVEATKVIEANTDFINETEAAFLEELFISPSVMYYAGNDNWVSANITETSYTKQTKANDKIIQYLIGIELGNRTVVQNR